MEKIDAVITWVDGSEPNFKLKLEENLKRGGEHAAIYANRKHGRVGFSTETISAREEGVLKKFVAEEKVCR